MDRAKQSPDQSRALKLSAAELAARHPRTKPLAQSQLRYGAGLWPSLMRWFFPGYPKD